VVAVGKGFVDYLGGSRQSSLQSKTKKRKIYQLPPQAAGKGFVDKKIRKK
jgi:hypothetical protein